MQEVVDEGSDGVLLLRWEPQLVGDCQRGGLHSFTASLHSLENDVEHLSQGGFGGHLIDVQAGHEEDVVAGSDSQQQGLPVNVDNTGGDCCQQAFEHFQLDSVIRDVIATAEKLQSHTLQKKSKNL